MGSCVSKRQHGEMGGPEDTWISAGVSYSDSLSHKKRRVEEKVQKDSRSIKEGNRDVFYETLSNDKSDKSAQEESKVQEKSVPEKSNVPEKPSVPEKSNVPEKPIVPEKSNVHEESYTEEELNDQEGWTDDKIENCCNVKALRIKLKQCKIKLASTEIQLQTEKSGRITEREQHRQKEIELEAFNSELVQHCANVNRTVKEENFKKNLELLESEFDCAVCHEVFIQATVLNCGHTFCSHCINDWSKRKVECPTCRQPFNNRTRNIELDNYIVRVYESFKEETCNERKTIIKNREEQTRRAEVAGAQAVAHAFAQAIAQAVPVPPMPIVINNP